ncbi:hypothetical protein PEC18_09270 [Paucibacter sp. O1-1]|nr:hypothetical protein [Paucibacter sp. O1-1]MDA3826038.1 hypothetical protein [Paucibacter sp. O1-1]
MKNVLSTLGVVLASLLIAAFVFLAARGLIDPSAASARFGAAATDAAGQFYYRVYLSRNLVIVLAAAAFLVLRRWRPLAIVMTLVILLPLFDISSLKANGIQPPRLPLHRAGVGRGHFGLVVDQSQGRRQVAESPVICAPSDRRCLCPEGRALPYGVALSPLRVGVDIN